MSEVQLGAAKGGDHGTDSGDAGATTTVVDQNGEHSVGIVPSAGQRPPGPRATVASGDDNNPLRVPLIERPEGRDIEEGGEDEEENEALEEINNLLWIKGLAFTPENRCKEALESWKEKDKLFTSRIDRKRKQSADFQNEVYQLLGFYSVFQGVLLTAVAQSNLLHCNNTWTATLLSSLASFVCIIGVVLKLRKIKELEHTIASEELTRRAVVNWQLKLRESGSSFNFKEAKAKKEVEKKSSWWLGASFLAIAVALTVFSVAFVVSIRQILCNPGHTLLPGDPG